MRATCESCGQVQPPDWQPGDLCGHCGAVVRREKRCHWCVKLTPAGKFCRHCGGGLVPDEQYGAARWLKHLGSDQFLIPERLAAMDPEQVEHFVRLYQRHANVMERHLDDMAYAQGFARQRGWVRHWEEVLLPRLPLPEDELRALTIPPAHGTTDAERLLEIRTASPLPTSQGLAAVARLRLWQTTDADYVAMGLGQDVEMALTLLRADDPALRLEAALALSHWRFVVAGAVFGQHELEPVLYEHADAAGPLGIAATVHLALLRARMTGKGQPVPPAALAAEDDDLAFAAALAGHVPDPLRAALRLPRRRFAAALTLTKMGDLFDLASLLPDFTPDQVDQILRVLTYQQQPRPDLRAYFQAGLAGRYPLFAHNEKSLRELLLLDLRPGEAVDMLRARPDADLAGKLLLAPTLEPTEHVALCAELVALDLFDPPRVPGLTALIQADGLPLRFIPDTLGVAPETSFRGLQTLAYFQFDNHTLPGLLPLHNCLRSLRWNSTVPDPARNRVHELLTYWYAGRDATGRPTLTFTEPAAAAYFPSFPDFVTDFLFGLENPALLETLETGHRFYQPLLEVRYVEEAAPVNGALATLPPTLRARLCAALLAFVNTEGDWYPRQGALHILNLMRRHAPWEAEARARLETLLGGYYDYEVQQLLAAEP